MNRVLAALLGLAALMAGCGPNCQAACEKAFGSECDIQRAGLTEEELWDDCVSECETALKTPGELDGYNPNEPNTSGESVELHNDKQAAAWMDCVEQTACEHMESDRVCAPI